VATNTFDRARRRLAYRRLGSLLRRGRPSELLPLDEATRRLRPFARRHIGLQPIPLAQVVGTDSRGADFDRDFLPRRPEIGLRWRGVEQAFPEGGFPPIAVYKLGDAYFIIDGHHRVAIARQRGMETIDAEVIELTARWHLPADADLVELIHAEQERIFMEDSGLGAARPDAHIRFYKPVGYLELIENVQIHGYHLMTNAGRVLSREEIAGDWYDNVYLPSVEAIRAENLHELHPGHNDADFFLCVYYRRRELYPEVGCVPLSETAKRMREDARRGRGRLDRFFRAAA
jgi:ParB-like nuclease domain